MLRVLVGSTFAVRNSSMVTENGGDGLVAENEMMSLRKRKKG